ncbi:MAG: 23S rRNA (adenine(2503)-C(2))-methyltransferase RlmN [Planctomycetota bacterium]
MPPHLRDLTISALHAALPGGTLARRLALAVHRRGALDWDGLGIGRAARRGLEARFAFGPQLTPDGDHTAADGTRKFTFRLASDERIETVLIRNRSARTLCVSSQAGCALGCTFCATGRVGLLRNLTAGEITESVLRTEQQAGARVTDVVFMGQGEPLHNYDSVMDACSNLNDDLGPAIGKKHISVSTSGLVPEIRRFTDEGRRWRLYLSLHSAVQETRERIMPVARRWALPELLAAMRDHQERRRVAWLTLQYVAIPEVNMDARHIEALARELAGLRYILNVIPYNDADAGYRAPSWAEVKEFTTRLRALGCPVKTRYSAGKQEGMGCGQLSAGLVATEATEGHLAAPPGIFTG